MVKNKAWPDSAAHPQSGLSLLLMPFILRLPLDPAEAGSWQSSKSFSHPPTNLLYSLPDLSYGLCLLTILTYSFLFVSWLPPSSKLPFSLACNSLWTGLPSLYLFSPPSILKSVWWGFSDSSLAQGGLSDFPSSGSQSQVWMCLGEP